MLPRLATISRDSFNRLSSQLLTPSALLRNRAFVRRLTERVSRSSSSRPGPARQVHLANRSSGWTSGSQDVNGVSWLIGSDTSGESGRGSSSDRTRTWTYSLEVSADRLNMLTREEGFPPG